MTSRTCYFCFLVAFLVTLKGFAQLTPLYVAPATDHRPVARVSLSSSAVDKPTPVLEAEKKAQGWFWAEYKGPFDGYIESRDMGQGQRPKLGAIVYAEPRVSSPVITTVEHGDQGSLLEATADGRFYRVGLNKTIGVYFNERLGSSSRTIAATSSAPTTNRSTPAPTPVTSSPRPQVRETTPTPPPVVATAPKPAPTAAPATSNSQRSQVTIPATPPPSSQPVRTTTAPARAVPTPQPTPVVTTPAPAAQPQASGVPPYAPRSLPAERISDSSVTLQGILTQTKKRFLFFAPPQPYALVSSDGTRMAWLDLSEAVISRPLPEMFGAEVTVYGEFTRVEKSDDVVLVCRSLRLALK